MIVITPEVRYYEDVEFNDETEMDAAYGAVVERAKNKKATAIITITTAREKDVARVGTGIILVGQVGRGKSTKMFVPDYFWTELKIGQHKPAIFDGKQSGGSGNTEGL